MDGWYSLATGTILYAMIKRSYFLIHPLLPRECIGKYCPRNSISQFTPKGKYQEHILVWKAQCRHSQESKMSDVNTLVVEIP